MVGGAAENFTYGDSIRYNIIMRCNTASLFTRKVHHEKEIPDAFHQREHERPPYPDAVVSADLLRCGDAVARYGVGAVCSGLRGCTGLGCLLPSRCGSDDRQAWSDDQRAVLTNGGFGPLLFETSYLSSRADGRAWQARASALFSDSGSTETLINEHDIRYNIITG